MTLVDVLRAVAMFVVKALVILTALACLALGALVFLAALLMCGQAGVLL